MREETVEQNRTSNLLFGFLIGTLIFFLIWYWQKATSAEDGALDLLDRHADAQAQLRRLDALDRGSSRPTTYDGPTDDLEQILGIGPTYARRLQEAGIHTYSDLAQQTPDHIREITGISLRRTAEAAEWIGDARRLSNLA